MIGVSTIIAVPYLVLVPLNRLCAWDVRFAVSSIIYLVPARSKMS